MEIMLKEPDAEAYVEVMRKNAWKIALIGTSTEISGQSEALEKFLSTYQKFVETVLAYQLVLSKDIQSVSKAVSTLTEADKEQSEMIEGLGAFPGLLGSP